MSSDTIGVLALQGAFAAHRDRLERLGRNVIEVRNTAQLDDVCALVLPGGESTTMTNLLDRAGMREPLLKRLADGMPTFATCAGLILLANEVIDGRPDQVPLGAIDVSVRRNGYGRQIDSFEADLDIDGLASTDVGPRTMRAVFIRAPIITRTGSGVRTLATLDDVAVVVSDGQVLACAFHPELTDDVRLHQLWLERFVNRHQ